MDLRRLVLTCIITFAAISISSAQESDIYVGRRFGSSFHRPSCQFIPPNSIEMDSLIHFTSIDQALAAGYQPCSQCIGPIDPIKIRAARREYQDRVRYEAGRQRTPLLFGLKLGSKSWLLDARFKIDQGPIAALYLGLSAGMTWEGGSEPPGIPFDGNAFSWWIYKSEYRKRGVQLLGSVDFLYSSGLLIGAAFGYAAQERFSVYWSTATYWEWYKPKDVDGKLIGTAMLGYMFSDSFGIMAAGSTAGEIMGGILVGWSSWTY